MKSAFGYMQNFGLVLQIRIITNPSLIYVSVLLDYAINKSKVADVHLFPAGIYLLKINNRNNRTRCEICAKLTIKTLERRQSYQ